jgi:hypothetical protein
MDEVLKKREKRKEQEEKRKEEEENAQINEAANRKLMHSI